MLWISPLQEAKVRGSQGQFLVPSPEKIEYFMRDINRTLEIQFTLILISFMMNYKVGQL